MTLPVFVVEPEALRSDRIGLAGGEAHHAAVVKRIRVGERITLTDGRGAGAECSVVSVTGLRLVAEVRVRRVEPAPLPRLVVVQAVPKGDHAERAVDLLTEIGVDVIVPWAASRNVVSWRGERGAKALGRWRSAAQAAAKRSRRLRFPEILDMHTTTEVLPLVSAAEAAFVLHEAAHMPLASAALPSDGDLVLIVGPEGGVTDDELASLDAAGATPARLGPTVLRSSSAGMVGASVVLSRTARWR